MIRKIQGFGRKLISIRCWQEAAAEHPGPVCPESTYSTYHQETLLVQAYWLFGVCCFLANVSHFWKELEFSVIITCHCAYLEYSYAKQRLKVFLFFRYLWHVQSLRNNDFLPQIQNNITIWLFTCKLFLEITIWPLDSTEFHSFTFKCEGGWI